MAYPKYDIYVPSLPIKDQDVAQFIPLVERIANKTCKKLSPHYRGPKVTGTMTLNILGHTYEDVYQEILMEVPHAITSFISTTNQTFKPEYKDYFEHACFSWVKKCLSNRAGKLISAMWVERQGQAFNHVTGIDSDVYFLGLSPTEVKNEKG